MAKKYEKREVVEVAPVLCPSCKGSDHKVKTSRENHNLEITIDGVHYKGIKYTYMNCNCGQVFVVKTGIEVA